MSLPSFSVIIVSWQRPEFLKRCLQAVRQLDYDNFEIVVVAEAMVLGKLNCEGLKTATVSDDNISVARNIGVGLAAGEFCAFIDDDAVPEPMWLSYHAEALQVTGADATVGYVRGRNGISFQSQVNSIDKEGETHVERPMDRPKVPCFEKGRFLKLIGTNMVIRRSAVAEVGGFDSRFKFFLDDSDISIRLSELGKQLGVAPLAEVHHGFAASVRRSRQRVPLDLFDVGRSAAIFVGIHGCTKKQEIFLRLEKHQRNRLLKHLISGGLEPRNIGELMRRLAQGWQAGMAEEMAEKQEISVVPAAFCRIEPKSKGHAVLTARYFARRKAIAFAEEVATDKRVSVFSFSPTMIRQKVGYTDTGVWVQTGGQFGRSVRQGTRFLWCRFASRVGKEIRRVAKQRGIAENESEVTHVTLLSGRNVL